MNKRLAEVQLRARRVACRAIAPRRSTA